MNIEKSKQLHAHAVEIIPGGTNTNNKRVENLFDENYFPSYIEKASGAYVWDLDGNKYIDYIASLCPINIGYNNPKIKKRVISTHTCKLTKKILEEVVAPEATGLNAAIPGYSVAGKTGTAQKVGKTGTYSDCQYTSSFIGFISASPPELVIVVVIDEPEGLGYGGVVAAPLFSKIGKQTLSYLGILPSKPSITDKNSILIVKRENKNQSTLKLLSNFPENDKEPMMPDFTGMTMRHVFKIIDKYKIRVKITGSGIVVGQNPPPGSRLPEDRKGWIILQPPA